LRGDGVLVDAPVSDNVFEALIPDTKDGRPLTVSGVAPPPKVAVLNGTTTAGLATRAARRLGGYVAIGNFTRQQVRRSNVRYAPGHRAEAQQVAERLGIAKLMPLDADTRDIGWDADVVVVLGRMR
jgi:alanine dehydrogenase